MQAPLAIMAWTALTTSGHRLNLESNGNALSLKDPGSTNYSNDDGAEGHTQLTRTVGFNAFKTLAKSKGPPQPDAKWLDKPFYTYVAQCSHNTYMDGKQGLGLMGVMPLNSTRVNCVDEKTMSMSLRLVYRCIEIDVWPRRGPNNHPVPAELQEDFGEKELVKVTHAMWSGKMGQLANSVSLYKYVLDVLQWMNKDEADAPASAAQPKMPVVISVENNVASRTEERYMAQVFQKFEKEGRLVMPAAGWASRNMSAYVADGATESRKKRQIILKSGALGAKMTPEWKRLVAMDRAARGRNPDPDDSRSMPMPSKNLSWEVYKGVKAQVDRPVLVRTYPNAMSANSGNYNPNIPLLAGAQMVCINIQGRCSQDRARCKQPVHMQPGGDCQCDRDWAVSLEKYFNQNGYDGWISKADMNEGPMCAGMQRRMPVDDSQEIIAVAGDNCVGDGDDEGGRLLEPGDDVGNPSSAGGSADD